MSPRRNRRPPKDVQESDRSGTDGHGRERVEWASDGAWTVRHITGTGAVKPYRCPGCDQEIAPGVPHIVAWPAEGGDRVEERRHWHTMCWNARHRRRPTARRSRGPRGR